MKSYEKLLAFYKQYVIWNVYMGSCTTTMRTRTKICAQLWQNSFRLLCVAVEQGWYWKLCCSRGHFHSDFQLI